MVRALLELLDEQGLTKDNLEMTSDPLDREGSGLPIDLGSDHPEILDILNHWQ